MKTVRFIRSILLKGQHCEEGSTATFPPELVAEAINCGDAVVVNAPETAEAPRSGREKATSKTAKD